MKFDCRQEIPVINQRGGAIHLKTMFGIIINPRRRFIRDSIRKLFMDQKLHELDHEFGDRWAGGSNLIAKGIGFEIDLMQRSPVCRGTDGREKPSDEHRDTAHEVMGALMAFTPAQILQAMDDLSNDEGFQYGIRRLSEQFARMTAVLELNARLKHYLSLEVGIDA